MPRAPEDRLPADRLIVALDVDSLDRAAALVDALHGTARRFKIGSQLFTAVGPAAVEAVRKRGGEVFLDLKFHDIPNTVEGAAREAVRLRGFIFKLLPPGGPALVGAVDPGGPGAAHNVPPPPPPPRPPRPSSRRCAHDHHPRARHPHPPPLRDRDHALR